MPKLVRDARASRTAGRRPFGRPSCRLPKGWRGARGSLCTPTGDAARARSRLVCRTRAAFFWPCVCCCDVRVRARARLRCALFSPCSHSSFSPFASSHHRVPGHSGIWAAALFVAFFFRVCASVMLTLKTSTPTTSDGRARAVITPIDARAKASSLPHTTLLFCPGSATAPPLCRHDTQRTATHGLLFSALSLLHRILVGNTHTHAHAQTFSCKDAQ